MQIRYWISLALTLFCSPLFSLEAGQLAISRDGQTVFFVERILDNGMAQVLQRLPLSQNPQSQQVSQQSLFAQVSRFEDLSRFVEVVDEKGRLYDVLYLYSNGYIHVADAFGSESIRPSSEFLRIEIERKEVVDETGKTLTIFGSDNQGRVLVGESRAQVYFRPKEGLIRQELVQEQQQQVLQFLQKGVLKETLKEIWQGRPINLNDPIQFTIFSVYLSELLQLKDFPRIKGTLGPVRDFIGQHCIPPKESVDLIHVTMPSGRRLQLRRLSLQEAPFRGYLGNDCSTQTRLLRALEPAHFHFIIEEIPFRPLGQIEIVRGRVEGKEGEYAFFERIQSSKNIRVDELGVLLLGLTEALAKKNIRFVMAKDLETYGRVAHDISNFKVLEQRLEKALKVFFIQSSEPLLFSRHKDQYIEGRENQHPVNLVANHMEFEKEPVFELLPRNEMLEGKAKLELMTPRTQFDPISTTLLKKIKTIVQDAVEKSDSDFQKRAWRSVCENLLD